MLKLGIDTGGTFTDFFLQAGSETRTLKLSSTPDDPSRAILSGLASLFEQLPENLEVIHGSTVGTNSFLERKGAKTLLITTHGFEDILVIGRQNRSQLYSFRVSRPAPIIPFNQCLGVKERVCWDGSVQRPLGKSVGKRLRAYCRREKIESVAVCLLHSYANDSHEKAIKSALAGLNIPVTLSSELLPEFREYERLSTTLINAYLAPVISRYIDRLACDLKTLPLYIQQSNGGMLPAKNIGERAVCTLLSGPAGGVHGAFQLARDMEIDRIITFDMGGTSTDVSLCDGQPTLTREHVVDGYPVRVEMLDIHTVGSGGGSLAWIDGGGHLRVGPESAGAVPGPVCYGTGTRLTVTDANLFLGRLLPDFFLGGAMKLDRDRVEHRMEELAAELEMDSMSVALGIVRLVNAAMAKAIRAVSLERGYDPKEFTLFGFGGAAGLHCCDLAAEMGVTKVVIPARAGILSAQGMVYADPTLDYLQPLFLSGSSLTLQTFAPVFAELEQRGREELAGLCSGQGGRVEYRRFLNLRYQGQSYELCVPCDTDFPARFHELHRRKFGYMMPDATLELVSIQCSVRLVRDKWPLPRGEVGAREKPFHLRTNTIHLDDKSVDVPVFRRETLLPGHMGSGPALIIDDFTTILVSGDFDFMVDPLHNIIMTSVSGCNVENF